MIISFSTLLHAISEFLDDELNLRQRENDFTFRKSMHLISSFTEQIASIFILFHLNQLYFCLYLWLSNS